MALIDVIHSLKQKYESARLKHTNRAEWEKQRWLSLSEEGKRIQILRAYVEGVMHYGNSNYYSMCSIPRVYDAGTALIKALIPHSIEQKELETILTRAAGQQAFNEEDYLAGVHERLLEYTKPDFTDLPFYKQIKENFLQGLAAFKESKLHSLLDLSVLFGLYFLDLAEEKKLIKRLKFKSRSIKDGEPHYEKCYSA